MLGDGDGDRDAVAQDFRAIFESEPETERVLSSRSGARLSLRFGGSYATSSGVWSAPIIKLDMVN